MIPSEKKNGTVSSIRRRASGANGEDHEARCREKCPRGRRITECLLAMLEDGLAARIAEVMRDASTGEIKLAPHQLQMIDMILDRTEGKPLQAHKIETNQVDENTARLLADLLERREAAESTQ